MGRKLRVLSSGEVVKIFEAFGFAIHSQKGSHMKLRRMSLSATETLIVPAHKVLRPGTLKSILRKAIEFIPEKDLVPHFYSE